MVLSTLTCRWERIIKMALYCPQGSGTLPQQLSMMHGIVWYCMVLHGIVWYCMVLCGIAWYCMVLHCFAWYCMELHGIAWYCMELHGIAWYCMVLHYLALSCTILHIWHTGSQQMSPVIAFDIAVVAQKVKVQCYIMADMLNSKKLVGLGEAYLIFVTTITTGCVKKRLPKAQRTRGLSSYHKFTVDSSQILIKLQFQNLN